MKLYKFSAFMLSALLMASCADIDKQEYALASSHSRRMLPYLLVRRPHSPVCSHSLVILPITMELTLLIFVQMTLAS